VNAETISRPFGIELKFRGFASVYRRREEQGLCARRSQFAMNLQSYLCSSLLAAYALCFSLAQAETLGGRVVKIADGDTVTILDESNRQHKVRLVGIDAPERKQPFGTRQHLADLVFGKTVVVKWQKRDRYQRILGKVLVDGQDVNLEQIKAGLAWHYKQYGKAQQLADRSRYVEV
jgi:endonuclease YncB( thermonuclease family)